MRGAFYDQVDCFRVRRQSGGASVWLLRIRLQLIWWRTVTTSKHCRGWEGRCWEAIMEIPTDAHQNEAATDVCNIEQTARVLNC